jgi:peptidyl-prolyl cis-trans isomerase SurA
METRRKILELLIDEKLAQEKIEELGIQVKPREVDEAIEMIKADHSVTHEDLLARLKSDGISYEKYWETVKQDLERIRLVDLEVKSKIVVSEEEIREYYRTHPDEFSVEEKLRLATVFLKRKDPLDPEESRALLEQAENIVSRARSGEDFGALARRFSEGPGAEAGGDLGYFKVAELDRKLQEVVESLSAGQISDPIVSAYGIQIIKVVEKQKGGMKPFDEVKGAIQRLLYREAVNKRYSAWIEDLRGTAYTKILF